MFHLIDGSNWYPKVCQQQQHNDNLHNNNAQQCGEWCGSSQGGEGMTVGVKYNDDDDNETAHTCPHSFPPPPYPSPSLSTIIDPSPAFLC